MIDDEPFWAYLLVTSDDLRLAELTERIGLDPDDSHDIGDPRRLRPGMTYTESSWKMNLVVRSDTHAGSDSFPRAIEDLGDDLADRLASLVSSGCEVQVTVVQKLRDDSASTGIHLTDQAVRWMARARGSLDVDQYVRVDRSAVGAWLRAHAAWWVRAPIRAWRRRRRDRSTTT